MIRVLRRFRRESDGQALVEFALVAMMLVILIMGVFEFGRALNAQQVLTLAAREGARRAVVADPLITRTQIEDVIKETLAASSFDPDEATITFPCFNQADGSESAGPCFKDEVGEGGVISVRIAMPYRFALLGPLISLASGSGGAITLRTVARFRNEG